MSEQCTLAAKAANSTWGALQRLLPALPARLEEKFPAAHSAPVRHMRGNVPGLCQNKKVTAVLDQERSKGPLFDHRIGTSACEEK